MKTNRIGDLYTFVWGKTEEGVYEQLMECRKRVEKEKRFGNEVLIEKKWHTRKTKQEAIRECCEIGYSEENEWKINIIQVLPPAQQEAGVKTPLDLAFS